MGNIFCLETEWNQSKHDLKSKSSALSLLEFLENANGTKYIFRQVATNNDFEYYMGHLLYDSYNAYNMVYLCFHGSDSKIHFANGKPCDIMEFAKEHKGIFLHRNVHLGSCSTLNMEEEDIKEFKRLTGARMVTGYSKDVAFIDSFVFELELLNAICNHSDYAAIRLYKYMNERMPYYVKNFGFVSY